MGGKKSKPVVEIPRIRQLLTKKELARVETRFKDLAVAHTLESHIDRTVFVHTILEPLLAEAGSGLGPAVTNRLFEVLNYTASGQIGYSEFLYSYYILYCAERELQFRMVFSMFDVDGKGRVTNKHLERMNLCLMQGVSTNSSDKNKDEGTFSALLQLQSLLIMLNYDRSGNAVLDFNDWRRYAEDDGQILLLIERLQSSSPSPSPSPSSSSSTSSSTSTSSSSVSFSPSLSSSISSTHAFKHRHTDTDHNIHKHNNNNNHHHDTNNNHQNHQNHQNINFNDHHHQRRQLCHLDRSQASLDEAYRQFFKPTPTAAATASITTSSTTTPDATSTSSTALHVTRDPDGKTGAHVLGGDGIRRGMKPKTIGDNHTKDAEREREAKNARI